MALKSTCPHCGQSGSVPDSLKGKKVRCKKCQKIFEIGATLTQQAMADPSDAPLDVVLAEDVGPPSRSRSSSDSSRSDSRRRRDEDDDRDRPRRRDEDEDEIRPRRDSRRDVVTEEKSSKALPITLLCVGGGALLVLGICGGLTYWGVRSFFKGVEKGVEQTLDEMAEMGRPAQNLDEALLFVKSPDIFRRQKGVDFLKGQPVDEARRAEVVKALQPLLNDPFVADGAMDATARWAGKDHIPLLLQQVEHHSHHVRRGAMEALGRLKDEKGAEAVAKRLPNHGDRQTASTALENMGNIAEKPVLKYITHNDDGVRNEARRILRAIGTQDAVIVDVMLKELQAVDANHRRSALEWLAQAQLDAPSRTQVTKACERLINDPDPRTVELAADNLSKHATAEQVPVLIQMLARPNDHHNIRRHAFAALGRLKDERGAAAVAARLSNIHDRRAASQALQEMGAVAEKELTKLSTNPDGGVRNEAIRLLKELGKIATEIDEKLIDLKGPDGIRKRQAASWFINTNVDEKKRDEVARALEPLLREPDPNLLIVAMRALGKWGGKDHVPAIIEILNEAPKGPQGILVRRSALEALSGLKDERGAAAAAGRLADPHDVKDAGTALVLMGPLAEQETIKVLKAPQPVHARMAGCQVLAAIGTKASLPVLQELSTDGDRNVSQQARIAMQAINNRKP